MIELIVLHKMSVCDCARACPFRLRHTAWLWRGLFMCVREREGERERESAPAVVMFGLLCKMLSATAMVGRMCFVYVFNDVSV